MQVSRRSTSYVCEMSSDDFKDPLIEVSQWQALNSKLSRYPYEQMILSRLVDSKVKCVDAYYLTTAGSTAFSNIFSKGFYSSFRKFAEEVQDGSGKTSSIQSIDFSEKIKPGVRYQMDICISFDEDMKLSNVFKDVAQNEEDVFALNSLQQPWKDIVISSGDNVLFEVCEEVEKLPSKLFQVERTLQLWDSCMPKDAPFPKVAGIIMNGDRDVLAGRVKRLQNAAWNYAGTQPKLQSLPVFIIYSKYSNVYLELSKLSTKLDAGFAKADAGFAKMNAGFGIMISGLVCILAVMLLK